ncbi:DUF1963 domain-containing protein [Amycolatopsis oliviviridis]|uniref:DUF1963 domain-containing protein n=1 Tax=Amycolatopsis oliviviridis TaxID=1471590 RepID=A0ABQ3L8W6_9PSEU|nr:YwqG family protein [Amycolatopsis oliviviridis]GHH02146.1 hypothetical protein GCM10017790_02940 [Amycolatopsis oliviviridis]
METWRTRLGALAHERLPADLATRWTDLFRPGIRLDSGGGGASVARLGGNPSLPSGTEWPECEGWPLDFVAAIDCAALPREFLTIALPERGTLLFFVLDPLRHSGEDWQDLSNVAFTGQVLFVPADVAVAERKPPADRVPYPGRTLFAEVVATAPEGEHTLMDTTETSAGVSLSEAAEEAHDSGSGVFGELVWDAYGHLPQHQVGGFALPIQGAVENDVAADVLGAWNHPRVPEEAGHWLLLAQIDSDQDAEMTWGDVGMLYWMIRDDDLAAGRFEAARCVMQCG